MPMPTEPELLANLENVFNSNAINFDGFCFRNANPKFANQYDIKAPVGSWKWGGRYNSSGSLAVLYLSQEPTTCMEEVTRFSEKACRNYYGAIRKCADNIFPRVFVVFQVNLSRVLNLTDRAVLRELSVTKRLLTKTNWEREQNHYGEAKTQLIGRLARQVGFEAILSPSARCLDGKNINVFCENLLPDSDITVVKVDLLNQSLDTPKQYRRNVLNYMKSTSTVSIPIELRAIKSMFRLTL